MHKPKFTLLNDRAKVAIREAMEEFKLQLQPCDLREAYGHTLHQFEYECIQFVTKLNARKPADEIKWSVGDRIHHGRESLVIKRVNRSAGTYIVDDKRQGCERTVRIVDVDNYPFKRSRK